MPAEIKHPDEVYSKKTPGGLRSRSFLGLLLTQFLGATNDNTLRWLILPIARDMFDSAHHNAVLAIGGVCAVLPYVLLAAPAGYLADRFDKRTVIVGCKVTELAIVLLGVAAILFGNPYLLFVVIALIGSLGTIFAPSKYGCIPEIVRADRVPAANGLIGLTTVLAIVAGTVAAGFLFDLTAPDGRHLWWIPAIVLVATSVVGLACSLSICRLKAANPTRTFPVDVPQQTFRDLATLVSNRALLLVALGAAIFWGLGVLGQLNIDRFVNNDLLATAAEEANQKHVGILQGMVALGVGVGSVLAGMMSRGRIELGIVTLGTAGIAVSAIMLFAVPGTNGEAFSPAYCASLFWLLLLGLGAGMYNVPLQAYLQQRSPEKTRGSILAASNLVIAGGMLVASGTLWLCGDVLGFSARAIFLLLGVAMVPVLVFLLWLLPAATARMVLWLMGLICYRIRVYGKENLPEEGGALLVANHVTWIDGLLITIYCPRPIRMVALAQYVREGLIGVLTRDVGVIYIEPGRKSVIRSIRRVRQALRDGELVGVFPEGTLTQDGELREFQPGFLSMLKKTGVPVIPVYLGGLWGSVFSFERGRYFWKLPRRWPYPVSIRIGRPIAQPKDIDEVRRAVAELGGVELADESGGEESGGVISGEDKSGGVEPGDQ